MLFGIIVGSTHLSDTSDRAAPSAISFSGGVVRIGVFVAYGGTNGLVWCRISVAFAIIAGL